MHVDIINAIKNQLRENYGHAGPIFAKAITEKFRKQEEVEKLKKQYRKKQQEFSRMAPIELGDRLAHYFAAVDVAARLVNEILDIHHDKAIEMIAQVFLDYVKDSEQDLDMPTRAMRHVLSWASGNERYFKNPDFESYGVWAEGEHIAIYPHKLSEVLKKEGFSEKSVLKEWANKGWIKKQHEHYTFTLRINTSMETKVRRFIVIPWEIVNKFNFL
jgi:hypothetical protein